MSAGGQRYAIRCSGCTFRFEGTLAEINHQAMLHDDSPGHQHIVLTDPPGVWPGGDDQPTSHPSPRRKNLT